MADMEHIKHTGGIANFIFFICPLGKNPFLGEVSALHPPEHIFVRMHFSKSGDGHAVDNLVPWIFLDWLLFLIIALDSATRFAVEHTWCASWGIDSPTAIDAVILWVNGSDPLWVEQRKAAEAAHLPPGGLPARYVAQRFTAHDELQWLVRSIDRFAPWVHTIHLVVDHQLPSWLANGHGPHNVFANNSPSIVAQGNTMGVTPVGAGKQIARGNTHWTEEVLSGRQLCCTEGGIPIRVHTHSELIRWGYHSYNSAAIQLHLHNIRGLSRRWVLFDDDQLLLRSTAPSDFFGADGEPLLAGDPSGEIRVSRCNNFDTASIWWFGISRSYELVLEHTQTPERGRREPLRWVLPNHVPIAVDTLQWQAMVSAYVDLDELTASPFRRCGDLQPQALYALHEAARAAGQRPRAISPATKCEWNPNRPGESLEMLRKQMQAGKLPNNCCIQQYYRELYQELLPQILGILPPTGPIR